LRPCGGLMSLTQELRDIALAKQARIEAARPAKEAADAKLAKEKALAIYYEGYGEGRKTLQHCEDAAAEGRMYWKDDRPALNGVDTDPWPKGFIQAVTEVMEESGGDLQWEFTPGQNLMTGEPSGSILTVWWSEDRPNP